MENQMSLIEIALKIMDGLDAPINIYTLIEETLAKKGIKDEDGSITAKLYTDITVSSKFVYMGDDLWDLKERQSLDQFDKDGSSFNSKDDYYEEDEEIDEDEDELDLDDEDEDDEESDELDDEDEDEDDEESEDEDNYDEESEDLDELDDEDDSEDSYDDDEDKYNKIMDDYEDLYED